MFLNVFYSIFLIAQPLCWIFSAESFHDKDGISAKHFSHNWGQEFASVLLADVSGHDYLVKPPEDDVVNLHRI